MSSVKPRPNPTQQTKPHHKPRANQPSRPNSQNLDSSYKHIAPSPEHIDDGKFDDDMELFDLLCVALHFAGVKKSCQQQILQAYAKELDNFDDDMPYGQEQMIAIIKSLRKKFPESFNLSSS